MTRTAADMLGPEVVMGESIEYQAAEDSATGVFRLGRVVRVGRCLAIRVNDDDAPAEGFTALMFGPMVRVRVQRPAATGGRDPEWVDVTPARLAILRGCNPQG